MPGESFNRSKEGFRFKSMGMSTQLPADSLPPSRSPYLQNIRTVDDTTIETRPGQVLNFVTAAGLPITDMSSYVDLETDGLPRYLARDNQDHIYLDTGALAGTLAGAGTGPGAVMIPFRPNQSPSPYMYIANGSDYQKFSAPDVTNAVIQQKVGIAEPQDAPQAAIYQINRQFINEVAAWTNGGTAGATGLGTRVNDTVLAVFLDQTPGSTLWSIQVSNALAYQRLMVVRIGPTDSFIVQDVFPALTSAITIQGIYYFTGTTGRCIIVPANVGTGAANSSVFSTENLMAALRRGAIIQVGAETCLVWSVTPGPDGSIAIETSTVGAHTTADTLTSVATIQVVGGAISVGQNILALSATYSVGAGIGTQTNTLASNPFVVSGLAFQQDDYMTFGVKVDDLSKLIEAKILIDIGDGTFTKNFYYYTMRPSDITLAVANTNTQLAAAQGVLQREAIAEEISTLPPKQQKIYASTQLTPGNGSWAQVTFPLGQLVRVGSDETQSLQNMNKVQFLWNASAGINVETALINIFGSFQPDVGDVGAPYQYRVRPRSSVTGVQGNPSPATRYGVNPRRENVIIVPPSAAYDTQIDTWDIFRFGGSVTSWRRIGTMLVTQPNFIDNYDDSAAEAGEALDFDNFEPWPSVDIPVTMSGVITGTTALVTFAPAAVPTNILRWLPGNLVQVDGQNVYTLWDRPQLISTTALAVVYLLQFVENAQFNATASLVIYEPDIANQPLPYMWGPDVNGTIFACGDPLRPGTFYFSKGNAPDSAPDTYNIELCAPSEPLIGGVVVDGLSFVASAKRWWALYPQPNDPAQRYNAVEQPLPRGSIAPYAICTDGVSVYWWAKDGIYSSTKGNLTDADLYSLFPHEGVLGETANYGQPIIGHTVLPPDLGRAGTFRMIYSNNYLYTVYQDSSGYFNVLVYDFLIESWTLDIYPQLVRTFYHPPQQAGTLLTNTIRYQELLMADVVGQVLTQTSFSNDNGIPIPVIAATFEFDGGDVRAPKQWGDIFLDAEIPAVGGIVLNPVSGGVAVCPPLVAVQTNTRTRQPISVNGQVISDFMGIIFSWLDDFSTQQFPTKLFIWHPSFEVQPAYTIGWQTFGTSFGLDGYGHIRQIAYAYVATAPVTVTITSYDGQSPLPIILPATTPSGTYNKVLLPVSANKGQLFKFQAASTAPFQFFLDDFEVHLGGWARQDPYAKLKTLSGILVSSGPV